MVNRSTGFRVVSGRWRPSTILSSKRVAFLVGDRPVGEAAHDQRPLELAVRARGRLHAGVRSAKLMPAPGWNPAAEPVRRSVVAAPFS